jgi:putative ABC transport system substrate-binding protein
MNRRDVITLLGGAVTLPHAARAQQPGRIRRVGVLMGIAESDPEQQAFVSAFTRALADSGWREGSNIRIDYRWGAGDRDRIRGFAHELVELQPDLIVGHTTPVVAALKQQTRTIPIVFIQVSDPVGSGFISGFAEPGGNITGFTNLESSMSSKLVELLKEIARPASPGSRSCSTRRRHPLVDHISCARSKPLPPRSRSRSFPHPFTMRPRSTPPSRRSRAREAPA